MFLVTFVAVLTSYRAAQCDPGLLMGNVSNHAEWGQRPTYKG